MLCQIFIQVDVKNNILFDDCSQPLPNAEKEQEQEQEPDEQPKASITQFQLNRLNTDVVLKLFKKCIGNFR